jgi:hypothetical protein
MGPLNMGPLNEDAQANALAPNRPAFRWQKPRFLPGARSRRTDLALEVLAEVAARNFGQ